MCSAITDPFDDRVRALCPGMGVDAVLHRTDKAVLLAGVLDGAEVVAKLLVDADEFWHARFTAEIDTLRAFTKAPPPVPAPRLLAADPQMGVLVTTRLPGVPVAGDRYPTRLDYAGAAPLLQAGRELSGWSAPQHLFPPVWDYLHRFHRYRTEYGLLDTGDEAVLNRLAAVAGPMRLVHGDLLPANVLRGSGGELTGVLDWEFTGRYLPGLDAALLWILLGHLPEARRDAQQLAGSSLPQQAGFWVNAATVCVRELRTHGELPGGELRSARLAYLTATWQTIRARVHELAGTV